MKLSKLLILIAFINGTLQAHWKVAVTGINSEDVSNVITALSKGNYQTSNDLKGIDTSKMSFINRSKIDAMMLEGSSVQLEQELKNDFYDLVFFIIPKHKNEKDISHEALLKQKYNNANYRTIVEVPYDNPINQARYIEKQVENRFLIGDIIDCFAGHNKKYSIKEFMGPIQLIETEIDGKKLHFFGIHVDKQKDINFAQLKEKLLKFLNIRNKRLVQVVGDSGRDVFTKEGGDYARKVLEEPFEHCGIIEYGYTGYSGSQGYDVNSIVNEYIDDHPEVGKRVLANIVGHIHIALNKWGCYASPYVRNFVVVYNNDGMTVNPIYDSQGHKVRGFTVFSEDVTMSDYMLQKADKDVTISLEGGTQCWKQIINMLHRSIDAELIYNIRPANKQYHFSVARILKEFYDKKPQTEQEALEVSQAYQRSLEHLWDTSRQDNSEMGYGETKKKLLREAMDDLIKGGLYKRVPELCTFYDAATKKNKE